MGRSPGSVTHSHGWASVFLEPASGPRFLSAPGLRGLDGLGSTLWLLGSCHAQSTGGCWLCRVILGMCLLEMYWDVPSPSLWEHSSARPLAATPVPQPLGALLGEAAGGSRPLCFSVPWWCKTVSLLVPVVRSGGQRKLRLALSSPCLALRPWGKRVESP